MREPSQQRAYWSRAAEQLLGELASGPAGLSAAEARARLRRYGPNALRKQPRSAALWQFLGQLKSPLVLILLFAAGVSASVGEWIDAAIIVAIVLGSAALSFAQEHRASSAVARLRARVTAQATVLRDGQATSVPVAEVVPGDVALLAAGSRVPADGVLLEANACLIDQAVLTGESFPAEKRPGLAPENAALAERSNCLFGFTPLPTPIMALLIAITGLYVLAAELTKRWFYMRFA